MAEAAGRLRANGNVRLFLNRGSGRFEEVTRAAGLDNARWSTAASFVDYDRDGWLDLVVGNYVDYNPTTKCYDPAGLPDFCGPQDFLTTVSRLYPMQGGALKPSPKTTPIERILGEFHAIKPLGKDRFTPTRSWLKTLLKRLSF